MVADLVINHTLWHLTYIEISDKFKYLLDVIIE